MRAAERFIEEFDPLLRDLRPKVSRFFKASNDQKTIAILQAQADALNEEINIQSQIRNDRRKQIRRNAAILSQTEAYSQYAEGKEVFSHEDFLLRLERKQLDHRLKHEGAEKF